MITDGWWDLVKDLPSDHISLISRLADKEESSYTFEFSGEAIPRFVDAFKAIRPSIQELVNDLTPHCKGASEDFKISSGNIEECLLHGVVPSHLLTEDTTSSPTPVSMINAAYCFYLTRLPELMNKLEGQKVSNLKDRKKWIERLEDWTTKGIENSQLLIKSRLGG